MFDPCPYTWIGTCAARGRHRCGLARRHDEPPIHTEHICRRCLAVIAPPPLGQTRFAARFIEGRAAPWEVE